MNIKPTAWACRTCGKVDWNDTSEQLAQPEHVCHRGVDVGTCKGKMVPLFAMDAVVVEPRFHLIDEPRNKNYRYASPGSYELVMQHCRYIAGPKGDGDFVADIVTARSPNGDAIAQAIVDGLNRSNLK